MQWEGHEQSKNVDDRRGMSTGGMVALGGGGLGVIGVILAMVFGVNLEKLGLAPGGGVGGGQPQKNRPLDPAEEKLAAFTKTVLRDTEIVWEREFQKLGKKYEVPTLVLYTDHVDSKCGKADSSVGPFYCPDGAGVFIDLSFYKEMEKQLGAPGEFARAYVIAHEVGHHVQRLLRYSERVDEDRVKMKRGLISEAEYNQSSQRLELQADFLAGVWAYYAKDKFKLNAQDIESALNCAHKIGDDYLQKKGRGTVQPDSFTHGTSVQRMRWFKRGYESGDVKKAALLFDLPFKEL